MKKRELKKELCLECLGAKDIYDGEEYKKCTTCKGKGHTTQAENETFLLTIRVEEEM